MIDLPAEEWPHVRPLRRAEYDRLVEAGCFADERIELVRGVLLAKAPQGGYHASLIARLAEALTLQLAGVAEIRVQSPFAASDDSEPEPDIAIVPRARDLARHPDTAHLLVEVADASGRRDRGTKATLYAQSRVTEYWVVDLRARVTDVFRDSSEGRWASTARVRWEEALALSAFPQVQVVLSQLVK